MRFLIDENLSPTLVDLARQRGHEAMAVRDLGLLTAKDWTLLERVQNEDWTLVTNNVGEFRKRYARKTTLHAGVVFLVDIDAGRDVQQLAFAARLSTRLASTQISSTWSYSSSRGMAVFARDGFDCLEGRWGTVVVCRASPSWRARPCCAGWGIAGVA